MRQHPLSRRAVVAAIPAALLASQTSAAPGPQLGRARRIGMFLTPDNAIDRELWEYCPPEVSLHITRLQVPGLNAMNELEWEQAMHRVDVLRAATLSVIDIEPELVVFGCTSSSFVDGYTAAGKISDTIVASGASAALTTSQAVIDGLRALKATRVAVGTPYEAWLGERLRTFLTDAGFEVVSLFSKAAGPLHLTGDRDVEALAEGAYRKGAECMFLSCTALTTRHLAAPLTARFGMPVITSTQAMMWSAIARVGSAAVMPEHPLSRVRPPI